MARDQIRVAVAGAHGKMGRVTVEAIRSADDLECVGTLVRNEPAEGEFTDLQALFADGKPHVIVDFTHMPDSKRIALAAIAAGVRPIVGTSGYGSGDIEELRLACSRAHVGCIFAPNFGIGAVLMMRFAEEAARHYRTVEIVEIHESGKLDAPSGTAMATARKLAAAGRFERSPTALFKAEGARGADVDGVGIHSLRLPGVVAHQEVLFGGDGETLRVSHESISRSSFMPGVLLAIRAAKDLADFVDGLEALL